LDYNFKDGTQKTLIFGKDQNSEIENLSFVKYNYNDRFIKRFKEILYMRNIQSVIVEGGTKMLNQFLEQNIFDEIRIIKSKKKIGKGIKAPNIRGIKLEYYQLGEDEILTYKKH